MNLTFYSQADVSNVLEYVYEPEYEYDNGCLSEYVYVNE
jgi:hypothetical protein